MNAEEIIETDVRPLSLTPPINDAQLTPHLQLMIFVMYSHFAKTRPCRWHPLVDDVFALSTARGEVCQSAMVFASFFLKKCTSYYVYGLIGAIIKSNPPPRGGAWPPQVTCHVGPLKLVFFGGQVAKLAPPTILAFVVDFGSWPGPSAWGVRIFAFIYSKMVYESLFCLHMSGVNVIPRPHPVLSINVFVDFIFNS